jgi:hypothetical protein
MGGNSNRLSRGAGAAKHSGSGSIVVQVAFPVVRVAGLALPYLTLKIVGAGAPPYNNQIIAPPLE